MINDKFKREINSKNNWKQKLMRLNQLIRFITEFKMDYLSQNPPEEVK